MTIKDRKKKWTYSNMENGNWDKFPVFATYVEAENAAVAYAKEHDMSSIWIAYLDCPDIDRIMYEYATKFENDSIENILTDIGCAIDSTTNHGTECYTNTLENLDYNDKEELRNDIYTTIGNWLKELSANNKIPLYPSKMIEYEF